MFFMDPFGSTNPDDLMNFGSNTVEHSYIFMHDQEPIDLGLHQVLFDEVARRNLDLCGGKGPKRSILITSEHESDHVRGVCDAYGWKSFYYFFHGWAALDWYRGYDKTFLIAHPAERKIQHSFISPNRIIGGQRDHRVLLIYHLAKASINHAMISCPSHCPQEQVPIGTIASKYHPQYPDILDIINRLDLPWHIGTETNHPMTSCWLDLFQQAESTLAYVVTETVCFGKRWHITEKTFKPICLGMPFVIISTHRSLAYLRSYGFQTFGQYWDESYDDEQDDLRRIEMASQVLAGLDSLTVKQRQDLYHDMIPVLKHNYDHFYKGGFMDRLWHEFTSMLDDLRVYANN